MKRLAVTVLLILAVFVIAVETGFAQADVECHPTATTVFPTPTVCCPQPTIPCCPTNTPLPTLTNTPMPTATALPTPWPTLPVLTPEQKPTLPPPTNTPPPKPTDPPITPVLGTPVQVTEVPTHTPEATPTKPGKYNTPVPTTTWMALPNTGELELSHEYDYILGLLIVLGIAVVGLLAISFALIATRK